MNEIPLSEFQAAILATHNCQSSLDRRVSVSETFQGHPVWEGEVLIFNLKDHPTAKTCYAWSVDVRVTAVLHEGPVDSPKAAVRAAIAAEHRCAHCGERLLQDDHSCPKCGRILRS